MVYVSSPQELREAFVQLPDNVRQWLASEKVLAVITDMNDRLEYYGDKVGVIPWLIMRLAVKDLAPKYFMSELRDYLVVDENEARAITEEIDKRILRPIEPALNRLGIDLNSLYLGQAPPQTSDIRNQISEIGAKEHFGITTSNEELKVGGETLERETPVIPEGPVILHTETEEISTLAQEKPNNAPAALRPSFSIHIPQSKYKKPIAPPPVTVRVEIPEGQKSDIRTQISESGHVEEAGQKSDVNPHADGQQMSKIQRSPSISPRLQQASGGQTGNTITPPKIMKVVHYSDFRTPLK